MLYFVWCSGGCKGGVHRWSEQSLIEDMVRHVEDYANRLMAWLENRKRKDKWGLP